MSCRTSDLYREVVVYPDGVAARLVGCPTLTELDVRAVGAELAAWADRHPGRHLILDLSGVRFLSAAGLSCILGLHSRVQTSGGRLTLVKLRSQVRLVFQVTRLDTVMEIGGAFTRGYG
jgi:anti-anti-sigma factor